MTAFREATAVERSRYDDGTDIGGERQGQSPRSLVLVDDTGRSSVAVEYSMPDTHVALIIDGRRLPIERDAIPALVEQLLAAWERYAEANA